METKAATGNTRKQAEISNVITEVIIKNKWMVLYAFSENSEAA